MDAKREKPVPEADESRRGAHNEIHYYNADEGESFDERGSQTEGPGEHEQEDKADANDQR